MRFVGAPLAHPHQVAEFDSILGSESQGFIESWLPAALASPRNLGAAQLYGLV